ncbi:hypothetical protein M408DRAFT_71511, partial [Serendipita vermifera MAFF 305830]
LTQIRTNHLPLNTYLHRIKKIDNPACQRCLESDEDLRHFLFTCPAYRGARLKLQRALKRSSENLEILLADEKGVKHLLTYVHETGRFKQTYLSLNPSQPNPTPTPHA